MIFHADSEFSLKTTPKQVKNPILLKINLRDDATPYNFLKDNLQFFVQNWICVVRAALLPMSVAPANAAQTMLM